MAAAPTVPDLLKSKKRPNRTPPKGKIPPYKRPPPGKAPDVPPRPKKNPPKPSISTGLKTYGNQVR